MTPHDYGFIPHEKDEPKDYGFVPHELNPESSWMKSAKESSDNPLGNFSENMQDSFQKPEVLGAMVGGTMGAVAGGPAGAIAGSGAGAYLGNSAKNLYNHYQHPEKAPQHASEYITEPLKAGAEAIVGEGIGRGIVAGYHGLKNLKDNPVMRKAGKIFHSMPEKFTQRYLDQEGELMTAPMIDGRPQEARNADTIMHDMQSYNERSGHKIEGIQQEIRRHKDTIQNNKELLTNRKQQLNDQYGEQKYQTGIEHADAGLKYGEAAQAQKEALQQVHVKDLVTPIQEAIEKLHEKVTHGSADAYLILGDQKGTISITPLKQALVNGMESMKLRGKILTHTDQLAYQELQKTLDMINGLQTDQIRYPEAKFILQRLGHDTTWTPNAGKFEALADQVKQKAREALDEPIKQAIPAYRQKMLEVEADTKLLKKASKRLGTPELAMQTLNNLSSTKGRNIDHELINKLGKAIQYNFDKPIQTYMNAKDILAKPSKMNMLKQTLPEHGKRMATQAEITRLGDPKVKQAIRDRLAKSNESRQLHDSEARLLNKNMELEQAQKDHEPFKPFNQSGVQARYKALNGARHYNAEQQFGDLDKATGHNFSQEVTDRSILDAFDKTDTMGSRKTVAGKAIGKFLVLLLGGEAMGGHAGAAIGASIGLGMDKYSGVVLRGILDSRIGLAQGIQGLEKQFGQYAPSLAKAADRGVKSLATTIYMLSSDPEFMKKLNDE